MDLQGLLGCNVDVVTEKGLRDRIRERVLKDLDFTQKKASLAERSTKSARMLSNFAYSKFTNNSLDLAQEAEVWEAYQILKRNGRRYIVALQNPKFLSISQVLVLHQNRVKSFVDTL